MATVGKVNKIPISGYDIEWHIPEFSVLVEHYTSPIFSFADAQWSLKLYLNNYKVIMSDSLDWRSPPVDHVVLSLTKNSSGPPIRMEFSLGFKNAEGKKEPDIHYTYIFQETDTDFSVSFNQLSAINFPGRNDTLTVLCTLKHPETIEDQSKSVLHQALIF